MHRPTVLNYCRGLMKKRRARCWIDYSEAPPPPPPLHDSCKNDGFPDPLKTREVLEFHNRPPLSRHQRINPLHVRRTEAAAARPPLHIPPLHHTQSDLTAKSKIGSFASGTGRGCSYQAIYADRQPCEKLNVT